MRVGVTMKYVSIRKTTVHTLKHFSFSIALIVILSFAMNQASEIETLKMMYQKSDDFKRTWRLVPSTSCWFTRIFTITRSKRIR